MIRKNIKRKSGKVEVNTSVIDYEMRSFDNGTYQLYIYISNENNKECIGPDFNKFIKENINDILIENNISIVGIVNTTVSTTWASIRFYIDRTEELKCFENDLAELQEELIDVGTTELGTEFSTSTIFDYDVVKSKLNSIIIEMLSRGYEIRISGTNDILNSDDYRIKEILEKEW